jgi:transposase-like protein
MENRHFRALMKSAESLTRSQREKLRQHLDACQSSEDSHRALNRHEPKACRYCQEKALVRNGFQNGMQRFLCRDCGRSSCATSETPLGRLRNKEKLAAFANCMREGLTVRETAARMGFSVDRAFRWRHLFLKNAVDYQPKDLTGVVEIDETYFRHSRKGDRHVRKSRHRGGKGSTRGRLAKEWVPVLIGRARGRPFVIDAVLPKMTTVAVDAVLVDAIDPLNAVVCADSLPAFKGLEQRLQVRCDLFVQGQPASKGVHVQSVNAYHESLKTWINRDLRGVATKYLSNYLAWHRLSFWEKSTVSAPDWVGCALGRQLINL